MFKNGRARAAASSNIVSTTASAAYIRSAVVDERPVVDTVAEDPPAVDRGPCVYCGKPVLLTQSRVRVERGRYAHQNPNDCKDEVGAEPDLQALVERAQPEKALLDGPAALEPAPVAAAPTAPAPAPAPPLARAAAIAPASPLVRTAAPAPVRPTAAASAAADTGEELSEYEMERLQNIQSNNAALARLGLAKPKAKTAPARGERKRPRVASNPVLRRSERRPGSMVMVEAAAAAAIAATAANPAGSERRAPVAVQRETARAGSPTFAPIQSSPLGAHRPISPDVYAARGGRRVPCSEVGCSNKATRSGRTKEVLRHGLCQKHAEDKGFWKKRKTCKVDRCNTRIRLAEEFCDKHKDDEP